MEGQQWHIAESLFLSLCRTVARQVALTWLPLCGFPRMREDKKAYAYVHMLTRQAPKLFRSDGSQVVEEEQN